jgi:hypothetical protein
MIFKTLQSELILSCLFIMYLDGIKVDKYQI